MLRRVLLWLGCTLLAIAVLLVVLGLWPPALWCGLNGALLTLGLVFERWQYRRTQSQAPGAGWHATGERFVDPGSGVLTEVWFQPSSGERRYVKVPDAGSASHD